MKLSKNMMYAGAGLALLLLTKKSSSEEDLQGIAIGADDLANEAVDEAVKAGIDPSVAAEPGKRSYGTVAALLGVGATATIIYKKIKGRRVKGLAPFDINNLPTPKQAAILQSVAPEAFEKAVPETLRDNYLQTIKEEKGLIRLATEKNPSIITKNAITLLPAPSAQLQATTSAESVIALFNEGPLKGTKAKTLANEIIDASFKKIDGSINEKQLEQFVNPRLEQMRKILISAGKPKFALSALGALECSVNKLTTLNKAAVTKGLAYVKSVLKLPQFTSAQVEKFFQKELSKELKALGHAKTQPMPSVPIDNAAAKRAEEAAAKKAEAAAAKKAEKEGLEEAVEIIKKATK